MEMSKIIPPLPMTEIVIGDVISKSERSILYKGVYRENDVVLKLHQNKKVFNKENSVLQVGGIMNR